MKKYVQKIKKPVFIHDRFFKDAFSDLKRAKKLVEFILSKKELQSYDISQLRIEKNTFKDGLQADLILSIPFKDDSSKILRLVIIVEHKSQYDKGLFNQLLKYQILIQEWFLKQTGRAQLVIPVLFYHGKQNINWSKSLQEEYFKAFFDKIPIETRKDMLNFNMRVINTKDPKVRRFFKSKGSECWGFIRLLDEIWDIKNPDTEKVREIIKDYFGELLKKATKRESREVTLRVIKYLQSAGGLRKEVWKKAEEQLKMEGILKEGGYMNMLDHIKEEGRWKGRKEGRQEGRKEGRQERDQEVILNMLKEKADISFISKVTGLPEKEIKKLKNGA